MRRKKKKRNLRKRKIRISVVERRKKMINR